ncbi:MAG TPA: hypothetical protein VGI46_15500 [Candidatus Acidoferrum sp.]|jgi:hypothetical protein
MRAVAKLDWFMFALFALANADLALRRLSAEPSLELPKAAVPS